MKDQAEESNTQLRSSSFLFFRLRVIGTDSYKYDPRFTCHLEDSSASSDFFSFRCAVLSFSISGSVDGPSGSSRIDCWCPIIFLLAPIVVLFGDLKKSTKWLIVDIWFITHGATEMFLFRFTARRFPGYLKRWSSLFSSACLTGGVADEILASFWKWLVNWSESKE